MADRLRRLVGRVLALAERRWVRVGFVLLAVALAALALRDQTDQVGDGFGRLGWPAVLLSALGCALALALTIVMFQVVLSGLGTRLPLRATSRVLLLGQVGKYVPGSVWAVVGPGEVARGLGVARSVTASAVLLQLGLSIVAGLITAAATLPFAAAGVARSYAGLLLLLPVFLLALHPRVVHGLLRRFFVLAGRPPPDRLPGWGRTAAALSLGVASWIAYGASVAALTVPFGVSFAGVLAAATGGFALAWVAGFLVVIAPAGAGVREAVLVLTLGPSVGAPSALVVALAHRAVLIAVEVGLTLLAAWLGRVGRLPGPAGTASEGSASARANVPDEEEERA